MKFINISILLLMALSTEVSAASRLFGPAPTSARSAFISQSVTLDESGNNTSTAYAQIAPVTMGRSGFGHQALVSKVLTAVPTITPISRPTPEILSASLNSSVVRTNVFGGWYGNTLGLGYNSGGYYGIGGNFYQPYEYLWQYMGANNTSYRFNQNVCDLSNQGSASFSRLCNIVRAPEPSPALWKNSAISQVRTNAASMSTQLVKLLKDNGISSGYFKYSQKIKAYQNGKVIDMVLKWDAQFDISRGMLFGNPSVTSDEDPLVLFVEYVPLKPETGVDPSLDDTPYKGYLRYVLKDKNNAEVSSLTSINTNGAYDEALEDSSSGESTECGSQEGVADGCVDSDGPLRCLLDKASAGTACPQGVPDVNELLDATGGNIAVVDYHRRLKPKYIAVSNPNTDLNAVTDEDTPSAEAPEEIAALTVQVGARSLEKNNDCNLVYKNSGVFSYILEKTVERYTVDLDGQYNLINQATVTKSTANAPYEKQIVLSNNATAASLDGTLLSPIVPDCNQYPEYCLIPKSAIYNLQGVAPIVDTSPDKLIVKQYLAQSPYNQADSLRIELSCAGTSQSNGIVQEYSGYELNSKNTGSVEVTIANGVVSPSNVISVTPQITNVAQMTVGIGYPGIASNPKSSTFSTSNIYAQEIFSQGIPQVDMCPSGTFGACDSVTGICQMGFSSLTSTSISACIVPSTSEAGVEVCDPPADCFFDDQGNQICPAPVCKTQDPTYSCPSGYTLSSASNGIPSCYMTQNKVFYLNW